VRLRAGCEPVLVDLGIARALWLTDVLTQPGAAPLTVRYAAPELLAGLAAMPAADVYALGLCLHEMLTGVVPLFGEDTARTLSLRLGAAAPDVRAFRWDIPASLALIVQRCLAATASERPTALDVARALERWLGLEKPSPSRWIPWGAALSLSLLVQGPGRASAYTDIAMASPTTDDVIDWWSVRRIESATGEPTLDVSLSSLPVDPATSTFHVRLPALDGLRIVALGPGDALAAIGWEGEACKLSRIERNARGFRTSALEACPLPRPRPMVSSANRSGLLVGDLDGDGAVDVLTWGERTGIDGKPRVMGSTWRGAAMGGTLVDEAFDLTDALSYGNGYPRRFADIDGDGCADFVVTSYPTGGVCSTRVFLLSGDCEGRFSPPMEIARVPTPGNHGDLGDIDGDGLIDLLLGPDDDGDPGRVWLLRGTGSGFGPGEEAVDVLPMWEEGQDRGSAGDVFLDEGNGDGVRDAFVFHFGGASGQVLKRRLDVFLGDGVSGFAAAPAFSLLLPRDVQRVVGR